MKEVKAIPAAPVHVSLDPWLDKLLDGKLRLLSEADWKGRYKSTRSAASAIHQAAGKRGMRATVAIRGDDLYVQGLPKAARSTRKATAKKVNMAVALDRTAKATTPRKRAAKKAAASRVA